MFERFADYSRAPEPADWLAGGKRMMFDRIEWLIMPDDATKAAALQNGEVDWWENPLPDLVPLLKTQPQHQRRYLRPVRQHRHVPHEPPAQPFNDVRARRAIMMAMDQEDYMRPWSATTRSCGRRCRATSRPARRSTPTAGGEILEGPRKYEAAKKLLAEAGYNGEKIVLLVATDVAITKAEGDVTADLLGNKLGMNVDYQALDWGTVGARRAKKEPPAEGGWNIFHTWHAGADCINPAPYTALDAAAPRRGSAGRTRRKVAGRHRRLVRRRRTPQQRRRRWTRSTASMDFVTYAPTGFFLQYQSWRKNLSGVVKAPFPVFWGVTKT